MKVRSAAGLLWSYLREVSGETAYDQYVERHRRAHPDVPALSRREFERRRSDARGHDPGSRCC